MGQIKGWQMPEVYVEYLLLCLIFNIKFVARILLAISVS